MLIQEVDRLSAAWSTLDQQNRDKVLNLIQYEDKLAKLVTEVRHARNYADCVLKLDNRNRKPTTGTSPPCEPKSRWSTKRKC